MPPQTAPRRTQAERTTETRRRLVDAAVEILQQKGYAGFRVDEVSRVAKVSRGAQTHHFATKDSLVLAAVEHTFQQSEEQTLRRTQALTRHADAVAALIADGVEYYLGPNFLVALNLLSVGDQAGSFRQAVVHSARTHRLRVDQTWVQILAARGATQAQAEAALAVCFDVIRGLAVRRFIDQDAPRRDRALERLHEIIVGLLAVPAKLRPAG